MRKEHLSETALQRLAIDNAGDDADIQHVAHCESCKESIAAYRLLFSGIKEQPKPAFDFDVAALVLPKLEAETVTKRKPAFSAHLLTIMLCSMVAVLLYLFRKNILFTFTGISTFFICVAVAVTLAIIVYGIVKMCREYQQKIKLINFS